MHGVQKAMSSNLITPTKKTVVRITTVFSLSKSPEMLKFLHEKHGKQIEMREKKGESAFARKTVKTLVKQKGDQKGDQLLRNTAKSLKFRKRERSF